MDETTNNSSSDLGEMRFTGGTSDSIAFTTDTTAGNTYSISTDDMWFPYYKESTWLPYYEKVYVPKWHIKMGYKNQINKMWN